MNKPSVYRFAGCEVDSALRQVRCNGVAAEPQPKALDLLLYLIAHRERVVDKDELLEKIWPGAVVSESALTQSLRKARAMVGDDGERQAVIRTIQRRGFRFVAELDGGSAPHPAPAAAAVTATHAPATTEPVAVLPFVDMSPAADQEYFCDGMAEEVINALALAGQRVVARTSSFAFKNRPDDVREIARKLGVTLVLEGSVRKAGDRLRVTAQLIDARSGFHAWSRTWDRRVEDMFAIQDEIAQSIAAALGPTPAASGTKITAAELQRRGRIYQHRFGQRAQRFAIEMFHQAIALDAGYAPAWAALALSYVLLYRYAFASDANRSEALSAAQRALELDPKLAEAWAAKGAATTLSRHYRDAEAAFEQAVKLGPNSFEAHYYYARAATETGDFAKAAALYERAATIDADDYQALVFASQCYRSLGQRDRSLEAERRALAAAERALARDSTDARALVLSAAALIHVGRADDARKWVARGCALEPDEPHCRYNAACAYVLLGEHERALDLLEGLDVASKANGSWMQHDVELDPLRDHPRFKAIMATTR
ncbi:MAG TPA: tetratricopeptide repeat protein [Gammaproteobacteria bacterium]|nr:tetratricopeptide repeat protein [Gammaproteobacteria bacterium]